MVRKTVAVRSRQIARPVRRLLGLLPIAISHWAYVGLNRQVRAEALGRNHMVRGLWMRSANDRYDGFGPGCAVAC